MTWCLLILLALATGPSLGAQKPKPLVRPAPAAATAIARRNPATFRATLLLDLRQPGVAPRIRFEWEQVPGASTYVLTGRWTEKQSWALRSREHRVTSRSATHWGSRRVTFDVSLPEGNHSWQLVALFGANDAGDFARPAHVSFDVR